MISAVFVALLVAAAIASPLPPPPHVDPIPEVHFPSPPSKKVGKPLIQPFEGHEGHHVIKRATKGKQEHKLLTDPVPQEITTPLLKGSHVVKRAAKKEEHKLHVDPPRQELSTPLLKGHVSKRATKLQDPPPGVHVDPRPTIFSIKPKPKK